MKIASEILTPEQVAGYLQLNKDTVYRYIREGKLIASRLGRSYRIKKDNLDLFLLATSTGAVDSQALFNKWMKAAERNRDIPYADVLKDVEAAVDEVRRRKIK